MNNIAKKLAARKYINIDQSRRRKHGNAKKEC